MHNKVMIVDDKTVITGSYNFSENAEANDETLLIFESAALAGAYNQYFNAPSLGIPSRTPPDSDDAFENPITRHQPEAARSAVFRFSAFVLCQMNPSPRPFS